MKINLFSSAAAAACLLATTASAQSVTLPAGFLPDPVTFDVYSGGPNYASEIPRSGGGCVGMVAVTAPATIVITEGRLN